MSKQKRRRPRPVAAPDGDSEESSLAPEAPTGPETNSPTSEAAERVDEPKLRLEVVAAPQLIPAPGSWPDCNRADDPAECPSWPGIGHPCRECNYSPVMRESGVDIPEVLSMGVEAMCSYDGDRDDCPDYNEIRYACRTCTGPTAAADGKVKMTRHVKRRIWTPPDNDDAAKEWLYRHVNWRYNTPLMNRKARKKMLGPVIRAKEISPGLPIEMATMWTGPPGSGKTSGMVESAYVMHRLGWKVLTNGLELIFEDGSFDSLRELAEIITAIRDKAGERVPTCVLLDEAPFWANARKWSEFDDGFFSVIQQVRKFGLALHYSSISPMQTDVNLRRLTLWWWVCQASWFRSFLREAWSPEEERVIGEKAKVKHRRWHRQMNHRMYDTLQLLDPTAHKLDKQAKDTAAERESAAERARFLAEGLDLGQPEGSVGNVIGAGAKSGKRLPKPKRGKPKQKARVSPAGERDDDRDDDNEEW